MEVPSTHVDEEEIIPKRERKVRDCPVKIFLRVHFVRKIIFLSGQKSWEEFFGRIHCIEYKTKQNFPSHFSKAISISLFYLKIIII